MPYDPEWLALEKELGGRSTLTGTPQDIIDQFNGLVQMLIPLMPPPDESVKTEDKELAGVPVRIYTPPDAGGKKLPVGVYAHGGGFICGDLNSEDPICRAVAKHTPSVVISVDYRLGPKYKQPAMIDDYYAVVQWAAKNADSIGGDGSKLFTIGGSAGGGLALCAANRSIKDGSNLVKGIVAMVPLTMHPEFVPSELRPMYKSYKENAFDVPVIDKSSMDTFYDAVLADARDDEQFAALAFKNHDKFPPTYISVCEYDPLRDDGRVMEKLLKDAGVKTKLDYYEGLPHYFHIMPQISKSATFVQNAIAGAQFVLA